MIVAKRHKTLSVTKQQSIVNVTKRHSIAMKKMSQTDICIVNVKQTNTSVFQTVSNNLRPVSDVFQD